MKIGTLVQPNQKGQIVIPKKIRDSLGIEPGAVLNVVQLGNGIRITPIQEVIPKEKKISREEYLKILEKTQGAWADSWDDKEQEKREKMELAEAKKIKKASW